MIIILKKKCFTAALSLYNGNNYTMKDYVYIETEPWSVYECQ